MAQKPANYNQMSPEDQAMWDYRNAGEEFVAGGPAVFNQGVPLEYQNLSPDQLAQLQNSGMENVNVDPRLKDAQFDALRQLENQGRDGFTARDQANRLKTKQSIGRENAGRMGAIQQNMAARGMSGSGMDLVAQMSASQAATDRDALEGLERSAQMEDRKNQAVMQRGQMSGQMRGQEFDEGARKAQAQDAINRFNTANKVGQQQQNNQGQNQANQQNWARTNQTGDRNVDAAQNHRRDTMGVGQGNAQVALNSANENYNRAQLRKQQRAAKRAGMGKMIGGLAGAAAGSFGGPAGAAAGYGAGSSLGEGMANFAQGGRVTGFDDIEGYNDNIDNNDYSEGGAFRGYGASGSWDQDDIANDTVPAMLSPGEIVIPRSLSKDPVASGKFVAATNAGASPQAAKKQAIPNEILDKLAKEQPGLVAQYKERMAKGDDAVKEANKQQDWMGLANIGGKAFTDFSNSQKEDVILKNSWQNMGNAPKVVEAKRSEYDGSALDKIGAQGVERAKESRNRDESMFINEQKYAQQDKANATEAKMKDPASAESAQARAYLMKIAPGSENMANFENLSAAQIEKVAPGLFDKYKMDVSERNNALNRQSQSADRAAMREQNMLSRSGVQADKAAAATEKKNEKMEQLRVGDFGYAQTPDDAKQLKLAVETKAGFDARLTELIKLREDYGGEVLNREAVGRAKQLSKELLLQYKEMAKLGVLSVSDEKILNAIIPDDPLEIQMFQTVTGQDSIAHKLEKFKIDTNNDYDKKMNNRLRREGRPGEAPAKTPATTIRSAKDLP